MVRRATVRAKVLDNMVDADGTILIDHKMCGSKFRVREPGKATFTVVPSTVDDEFEKIRDDHDTTMTASSGYIVLSPEAFPLGLLFKNIVSNNEC